MQWIKEPPTEDGWYWTAVDYSQRFGGDTEWIINLSKVRFRGSVGYVGTKGMTIEQYVYTDTVYWLGPILVPEPPEEK